MSKPSSSSNNKNNKSIEDDDIIEVEEGIVGEEVDVPTTGCGIMGRYPVLSILVFAASGIGLGFGLSAWDPDNGNDKTTAIQWIGLVGDMVRLLLFCLTSGKWIFFTIILLFRLLT